jgi:hypothetical protein
LKSAKFWTLIRTWRRWAQRRRATNAKESCTIQRAQESRLAVD